MTKAPLFKRSFIICGAVPTVANVFNTGSLVRGSLAGYNLKCNTSKKERQHANHSVKYSYHIKSNTR